MINLMLNDLRGKAGVSLDVWLQVTGLPLDLDGAIVPGGANAVQGEVSLFAFERAVPLDDDGVEQLSV